jgi:hypothetical protein
LKNDCELTFVPLFVIDNGRRSEETNGAATKGLENERFSSYNFGRALEWIAD